MERRRPRRLIGRRPRRPPWWRRGTPPHQPPGRRRSSTAMQMIGRYVVESQIGSGGLGVIWRARDPQLGRDVAIKVMSARASGAPDLLARFEREARTAAALAHRNIVTIHEYGIHDGAPYLVMELLGGMDLDERIVAEPPLTDRQKIDIAVQIAEALEFAHARGVVHRDLKPSNIRLLDDGTVKIIDFGLAWVPASTLTKTGELFGTVAWIAPEQLRGLKGEPRSDLFALGVMLFEMFEGHLPFDGESTPDVIGKILHHPPRTATRLPRELHAIIARALEKNPEKRWHSASEMLEALRQLHVASSGESPSPRVRGEGGRRPDEGRDTQILFTPGMIVAERYRIVSLLGSGGMGEAWRADDLRLGQRVALKFLAPDVSRDATRLQRLYAEVRIGRQVSHPNVCRIYDIGDADGHPFIAMQFIEGEDLGLLLRRVGQLSLEKSLDIARDICSGLAAAHAAGVIHRDLKPSNIMIDAHGRAIILDFGLASLTHDPGQQRPSGSLHYASPEQLAGRSLSTASDLYSLGLVLYELLTSRRAFSGESVSEVTAARAAPRITAPSLLRGDVPPALDRMILRCLSEDPAERPASAREILTALPGGDALEAAIAAGETPSPDAIDAAGKTGDLTAAQAWTVALAALALVIAFAMFSEQLHVHRRAPFDQPPPVLAASAEKIANLAGYDTRGGDSLYVLAPNEEYLEWLQSRAPRTWKPVERTPPGAIHLAWYHGPRALRQSSVTLRGRIFGGVPELDMPGMVMVSVDSMGNLARLIAVPPATSAASAKRADWKPLLAATGCRHCVETPPRWTPPFASDVRTAWRCSANGFDLRVEAASFGGKPVWLDVIGPWKQPPAAKRDVQSLADNAYRLLVIGALLGTAALARRNLRRGRGDRRRALRVGLIVTICIFAEWLFMARHGGGFAAEWEMFVAAAGRALFFGGFVWLAYMAAEPYVRRRWPHVLTSWYRFLDGRLRDPLVGRSVLFGVLGGAVLRFLDDFHALLRTGGEPANLLWFQIPYFARVADNVALLFRFPNRAIWNGLGALIILLLLTALVRNRTVAIALWLAVITAMNLEPAAPAYFTFFFACALLVILLRAGLLALVVALMADYAIGYFAPVAGISEWYASRTILGWIIPIALLVYGFIVSLAGKPPFGRTILEE